MKLLIKRTLKYLFILLLFTVANAQEKSHSPISPPEDDAEIVCGLLSPLLIQLDVSVWSGQKGYLNNLTDKDFEVFEKEKLRDIEFFKFNEEKNQYTIGFYQEDLEQNLQQEIKEQDIKVKLKLSKEEEKAFEKISITVQKIYLSKEN